MAKGMVRIEVLLAVVLVMDFACSQFLEQPSERIILVPESKRATLSCMVEESYSIEWRVTLNTGVSLSSTSTVDNGTLINRGFTFEVTPTRSVLSFGIFDGNQTNNETNISCIAQQGISQPVLGNQVTVIFYGAPPPPTDLSVSGNELGSLNISWSLEFIEGVPVNYTLTVLNLNTTSAQPIIIAGLLDQHYVFVTSRPCDVYSFTVTAVTSAGNSTPSQEEVISPRGDSEVCASITLSKTTDFRGTIPSQSTSNLGAIIGGVVGGAVLVTLVAGLICCIVYYKKCTKKNADTQKKKFLMNVLNTVYADVSSLETAKLKKTMPIPITITDTSLPAKKDIQPVLRLSRDRSTVQEVFVEEVSPERFNIVVTPQNRGSHILEIAVKGQHISGSPFYFEVPFKEFDRNKAFGLTTDQHGQVLLLEEGQKGIAIFQDHNPIEFTSLGEKDLAEITVHEEKIFVTTGKAGTLLKYNRNGILIDSKPKKYFGFSNGLAINSSKELYVCDTDKNEVVVLDLNLTKIKTLTGTENGSELFRLPRDVVFDSDNNIYIAEKFRIRKLTPDGQELMIGEDKIHDAICLKIFDGYIFVTNHEKACISIFSIADGKHIRDFCKDENTFDKPQGITIDQNGYVYVSTFRDKLLIFEKVQLPQVN